MRLAEARITLGVVAARQGDMDEAVRQGERALSARRRSLPSLLMDFTDHLDEAADITIAGLSILFVVWFYRARINAERHGYRQRRARGWAIWGWIVPIVNLWFPFQIMGDIWRAGLPAEQRADTAWLPALWWTCWLLSGLGIFGAGVMANAKFVPHIASNTNTASLCFLAVAGALLIAIIRAVSDGPVGSPA